MFIRNVSYLVSALFFLPPAVQDVELWITHYVVNLQNKKEEQEKLNKYI